MDAEHMETEHGDSDSERRAIKAALVVEIRKRRAAGQGVDVLMRELRKLDDPFGDIGLRGGEHAGRSQRHAGGRVDAVAQDDE